jgi:hypothetical protein
VINKRGSDASKIKQKKPAVKLINRRRSKGSKNKTTVKPTVKQSVEDNLTVMETSVPIQRPVETETEGCEAFHYNSGSS